MKLNALFKDQFQCMYLPFEDVEMGKNTIRLNFSKSEIESLDLIKVLKYREVVLKLTKKGFGTLVLSLFNADAPYEFLQKKYKETRLFYFWANNSLAYMKTLFGGRIQRKIASYGWFNDHTTSSEEQTLGKEPLEYEVEKGHVYKVTMDKRMVFTKQDLFEIFDYYVKLDRDENIDFDNVELYYNLNSLNLDWSMQYFSKPEFLQSLIHVRKNYKADFSVPFILFEDKETLRANPLKAKYEISKMKSAKNILRLGIFGAGRKSMIPSYVFFRPTRFGIGSFVFDLAQSVIQALKIKDDEPSSGICINPPEGEFIPATTSLVYFIVCFEDDGVKLEFYSLMKCGKSKNHEFICKLNAFNKDDLFVCYNQILDYVLEQNIVAKLNKK